jgi:HSP20 family protein
MSRNVQGFFSPELVEQLRNNILNFASSNLDSVLTSQPSHRQQDKKIPIDIVNEEKIMYIYAELPGVNKENVDVDFYNNHITIIAEKVKPYDNPEMCEIKSGKYERTLVLPICITKKETVEVTINNGVLKIKINKFVEEENAFKLKPT